jgi:hypothetical protein
LAGAAVIRARASEAEADRAVTRLAAAAPAVSAPMQKAERMI